MKKTIRMRLLTMIVMLAMILSITVVVPVTVQATGTTYYVDSVNGNDVYNGSVSTPWQTLSKVNSVNFTAGDKILFHGGQTFNGTLQFNSNDAGLSTNNIEVSSYGTGSATINAGIYSGITVNGTTGLKIDNLIVSGSGVETTNMGTGGIVLDSSNYITIDQVETSGFMEAGILINNYNNDITITNVYSHDNGRTGIYENAVGSACEPTCARIMISNCQVTNNLGTPRLSAQNMHSGNGIVITGAQNLTIQYCDVGYNGGNGTVPLSRPGCNFYNQLY